MWDRGKEGGAGGWWMGGWTYTQEGELQVSYPPQTIFLIDGPPIPEEKNATVYNKKLWKLRTVHVLELGSEVL